MKKEDKISVSNSVSNAYEKLFQLILKADKMGGNAIIIEYDNGYEQIYASDGQLDVEIGRIKSDSKEAINLRQRIYELRRRKRLQISGEQYRVSIKLYDDFGETSYKVRFQKIESILE